jgi:hypothetical protein
MLRISELFGEFYGGANRNVQRTFPEGRALLQGVQAPDPVCASIGMLNGFPTH